MDQKTLNKQFLIEFIEMYREFPCLWRVKSVEYRDRNKKNEAYDILLKKYKEIDSNATQKTVKNKIDSLRGAFRKELKKIKDSQKSGSETEAIYQAHLWYFGYLTFLSDQETPRETVSSIEDNDGVSAETSGSITVDESSDLNDVMSPTSSTVTENTGVTKENELLSVPSPACSSVSQKSLVLTNKKRNLKRKSASLADEVLQKVSAQLDSADEDPFDTSSKNIANKLRSLPPETAVVTEKLLIDILFEAQMGNVTRNTKVFLQETHQPQHTQSLQSQPSEPTREYYTMFSSDVQDSIYNN